MFTYAKQRASRHEHRMPLKFARKNSRARAARVKCASNSQATHTHSQPALKCGPSISLFFGWLLLNRGIEPNLIHISKLPQSPTSEYAVSEMCLDIPYTTQHLYAHKNIALTLVLPSSKASISQRGIPTTDTGGTSAPPPPPPPPMSPPPAIESIAPTTISSALLLFQLSTFQLASSASSFVRISAARRAKV